MCRQEVKVLQLLTVRGAKSRLTPAFFVGSTGICVTKAITQNVLDYVFGCRVLYVKDIGQAGHERRESLYGSLGTDDSHDRQFLVSVSYR